MTRRTTKKKEKDPEKTAFYISLLKQGTKLYALENGKLREKFSELEQYQRLLLEAALRVTATLKSLKQSRMFIQPVSDKPVRGKKDLTDASFLRYHLECYAIRVVTLKDVVLKLINRTYKLGVTENIGLEKNLLKHAAQHKLEDVDVMVQALKIIMQQLEPQRNGIAHGNYHDDVYLILLEGMEVNLEKSKTRIPKAELEEYTATRERVVSRNCAQMILLEFLMTKFLLIVYELLEPVKAEFEKTLDRSL